MISTIIQTSVNVIRLSFASADNIDQGLNNSRYHAKAESNNCLLSFTLLLAQFWLANGPIA